MCWKVDGLLAGEATAGSLSLTGSDPPSDEAPNKESSAPTTAESRPPLEQLLIVSNRDEGSNSYTTLSAACSAAKSGDTIELRFNGRREERPISLANIELTIRAGEQYHPIVSFRPTDPAKSQRSMLLIVGGQLTLVGVELELEIPHEAVRPDSWALLEMRQADLVRLQKSVLSIRNAVPGLAAYQPGVAFFDVTAIPGSDVMPMDPSVVKSLTVDDDVVIELENCIVRGEATLLRADEMQSTKLRWNNGLLVTSERLLSVAGGPNLPRRAASVNADLRHLTAIVHGGLALMWGSEDAPHQLSTVLQTTDCIFSGSPAAPLVEQKGIDRIEDLRSRLQWHGEHNAYDRFEVFWKLTSTAGADEVKQDGFLAWKAFWGALGEHAATRDSIAWTKAADPEVPSHGQTPDNYKLADDSGGRGGGTDGLDIGCLLDELPKLWSDKAEGADSATRQSDK